MSVKLKEMADKIEDLGMSFESDKKYSKDGSSIPEFIYSKNQANVSLKRNPKSIIIPEQITSQIQYYEGQKQMIKQCALKFIENPSNQNDRMVGSILKVMEEYIDKIVNQLTSKIDVNTKMAQLQQKVEFLRLQNGKIFNAYQQRNQQYLKLTSLHNFDDDLLDIRPITNRTTFKSQLEMEKLSQQNDPHFSVMVPLSNCNQSLKCSQVQQSISEPNFEIKPNKSQKSHIKYFQKIGSLELLPKQNRGESGTEEEGAWTKRQKSKIFKYIDISKSEV